MSKNKSFPVLQTVTLSASIKVDGVLTDPSAAVLFIKRPVTGDTITPAVSDDGTGLRSATYLVDEVGYWKYKWVMAGTAAGVAEGSFYVSSSDIDPA